MGRDPGNQFMLPGVGGNQGAFRVRVWGTGVLLGFFWGNTLMPGVDARPAHTHTQARLPKEARTETQSSTLRDFGVPAKTVYRNSGALHRKLDPRTNWSGGGGAPA